jgi:hypothetical protein
MFERGTLFEARTPGGGEMANEIIVTACEAMALLTLTSLLTLMAASVVVALA